MMEIQFYLSFVIILSFSRNSHEVPISNDTSYANILTAIYKETLRDAIHMSAINPKCMLCRMSVKMMEEMLNWKVAEDKIANLITDICTEFHIETPRVCAGLVGEFKAEVFTVFRKIQVPPAELCELWLGSSCAGNVDPKLSWNITLPNVPKPPVIPITPPKPGAAKSRVLHISDIHLDLLYTPGSQAECKEPVCCHDAFDHEGYRMQNTNSGIKIIWYQVANIFKQVYNMIFQGPSSAGKWGDFRTCDTPLILLENMLQYISETQKIDYVILTGDLPAHDIWNQTKQAQLQVLKVVSNLLLQYFPKTAIYPSLGNHEGNPVNSFPPPFVQGNMSIDWLYDILAQTWTTWLPNSTMDSIKLGAYYSVLVQPGFRIISINMNYCNNKNLWLFINSTDPANELNWLANELQKAETNKEKVHIVGHIPPGTTDCFKTWSWNYYRIVNRYESTIRGQFFGHTHFDEFELFYDENDLKRPISIAYIGPSVTPYVGLQPGFRIYAIDGDYPESSRIVIDHETYMMNLTEANISDHPKWLKEYSAKEAYNMTSLLPQDWDNLMMSMRTNDTLFNKYHTYYFKSMPPNSCDKPCKQALLCAMRSGRSYDPDMCKPLDR